MILLRRSNRKEMYRIQKYHQESIPILIYFSLIQSQLSQENHRRDLKDHNPKADYAKSLQHLQVDQ